MLKQTSPLCITSRDMASGYLCLRALLICVLLLFMGLSNALAESTVERLQPTSQALHFRQISVTNGLINDRVQAIQQDHRGFMWLGTGDGVTRTDGLSFKNYNHDPDDPSSLPDNRAFHIAEDNHGQLWIGTFAGLSRYDALSDAFISYVVDPQDPNALQEKIITGIYPDTDGLWLTTPSVLYRYRTQTDDFQRFVLDNSISADDSKEYATFVTIFDDVLYVGTTLGLFTFSFSEESVSQLAFHEGKFSAYGTVKGELWLFQVGHGLQKIVRGNPAIQPVVAPGSPNPLSANEITVTALKYLGARDGLWLGTESHGLLEFSLEDVSVTSVVWPEADAESSFSINSINKIYVDDSGLVWVATRQAGLFLWSPHSTAIRHIKVSPPPIADGVDDYGIWRFHETQSNEVYLGMFHGLGRYTPSSGEVERIDLGLDYLPEDLTVSRLQSVGESLWLSTSEGLIRHNTKTRDSALVVPRDTAIRYYYMKGLTAHGNRLFYGIFADAVYVRDLNTGKLIDTAISPGGPYAGLLYRTQNIVRDMDGSMWFLTRDGIVQYDPVTDSVVRQIKEGTNGLSTARITGLTQQNRNTYWVGTVGHGLNRIRIGADVPGGIEVTRFDADGELNKMMILGIVYSETPSPSLWISANGLFVYDINTNRLRQFKAWEGAIERIYAEGSAMRHDDGSLYFGGTGGFNIIDPARYNLSDYQPNLNIANVAFTCPADQPRCKESHESFQDYVNCLNYDGQCGANIPRFPHNMLNATLTFSSLDYTVPEDNQFRYRFKQSEASPWVDLRNHNKLILNSLESGAYHLEIQGSNFTGRWSDRTLGIRFRVAQPWYLKSYAVTLYGILLLAGLYYFRQYRTSKLRAEKQVLAAVKRNEQNFKAVLWGSGDELWEWHLDKQEVVRTNALQEIGDGNVASISQQGALELIHADDAKHYRDQVQSLLAGDVPHLELVVRMVSRDSNYLWVLTRARVVERDSFKRPVRVMGSLRNITEIKATEDRLKLIGLAFDNTTDGISVVDSSFRSIFNNNAFYRITGMTSTGDAPAPYFFSKYSPNYQLLDEALSALEKTGAWEGEIWERRPNGEKFAMALKIAVFNDEITDNPDYICVFSDITHRKKAEEELIQLANFDSLTNLPNRALFLDRLSQAMARARRDKSTFSLFFVDLDNFKTINDTMGHNTGDMLLVQVAERLTNCVREVDTVARIGGDEFTVILNDAANEAIANRLASSINEALSQPIVIDSRSYTCTGSIGIAMYPQHGDSIESLLKNADLAMYAAKTGGKNTTEFFRNALSARALERINIETRLREAISAGHMTLYYQPQVNCQTNKIVGFEALVRWIDPVEGVIGPGSFIPVAEESDLILLLGDWILEEGIRTAKAWSVLNPDACRIAINLSTKQFMSDDLPEKVSALLERNQLDTRFIELEITESAMMTNMPRAVAALKTLRDMGIAISLDDFGTGYSSLAYLHEFPVSKLKIDQSFVRRIGKAGKDNGIVITLITLAKSMGLEIIAEGCEEKQQVDFISAHGCELIQGYYYSPPVPSEEARAILEKGVIEGRQFQGA